jgi:deferrochelatase/peroxidase EfeB
MIRRGIPYGDWTDIEEKRGGHTLKQRGLLFVSYQSSLRSGFRFVMKGEKVSFYVVLWVTQ